MPATHFTRYPGGLQLALVPRRAPPPDAEVLELGERAFVLGADVDGIEVELGDGDAVAVGQVLRYEAGARVRFLYSLDLRSDAPAGWAWHELVVAGAVSVERPIGGGLPTARVRHYRDVVVNGEVLEPGDEVAFGLVLRRTDMLEPLTTTVELPGVWLDAVRDDVPDALWMGNRVPEPDHTAIPHSWTTLAFDVYNASADPIDLGTLDLVVDGQQAILGGVVQLPFAGAVTEDAPHLFVSLDISALTPSSSYVVDVQLEVETVGATESLVSTWSWVWSDTTAPTLVEVGEATPTTLWVWASEALADPPGTGWLVVPVDGPGYVPTVLGVRVLGPTSFELELSEPLTIGRQYRLTGTIEDVEGNTAESSVLFDVIRFRPADRVVDVYSWLPRYNREADRAAGQSLLLFARAAQDALELTLTRSGDWLRVLQPDRCPERYLPALLLSFGCPWPPDLLTVTQQRRLATKLVEVYQLAGTAPGLELAAQVLLSLTVDVVVVTPETWWQIGFNALGVDTTIAPPNGHPVWYTFWFDIADPELLTQAQLEWLDRIANTLRGAQEHYGGVYELAVPQDQPWLIGFGQIGVDTLIGL